MIFKNIWGKFIFERGKSNCRGLGDGNKLVKFSKCRRVSVVEGSKRVGEWKVLLRGLGVRLEKVL